MSIISFQYNIRNGSFMYHVDIIFDDPLIPIVDFGQTPSPFFCQLGLFLVKKIYFWYAKNKGLQKGR